MTKASWVWPKISKYIGQTGESYRGTLNATGMAPSALFARECIQNAADSANLARTKKLAPEASKLKMIFEFKTLTGEKRKLFIDAIGAHELAQRRDFLDLQRDCFLNNLDDRKQPITVLVIHDYNTTGLYGPPFEEGKQMQSHLAKLLFALGDRSKTREMTSAGGSYGFGKGALSSTSTAYTVIAYSRFDDSADNGVKSRLMGCGYFPYHVIGKTEHMGLAYFGKQDPKDPYEIEAAFENEEADNLASALMIGKRLPGETGTSLLIPDPVITPEELAQEIETWWFPALVYNDYEISVLKDTEKISIRPALRTKRPDLHPYVKAYRLATQTDQATGPSEKRFDFEQVEGKKTGSLGMVLAESQDENEESEEVNTTFVALVRSNKMVVAFERITDSPPCARGVFVASEQIDEILKISEPPAHHLWDANANKLDQKFGEAGKRIVCMVKKRIKDNANGFRRSAIPKKKPTDNHLKVLDRVLSKLFKSRNEGPHLPPSKLESKFSLQFLKNPEITALPGKQKIYFTAKIKVEMMKEVSEEKLTFQFVPKCQISEDEGGGEDLKVSIKTIEGTLTDLGNGAFLTALNKNERLVIEVESDPYSPEWTVNFIPTVSEEVIASASN